MNNDNNSLVKKTLIYLAGNFSSKIFGVIIIPIYATYLTASQLGKFDYQQTIAGLLNPIIVLALWEGVLRFGLKAQGNELKRVLSTAAIIASGTLSLFLVILTVTYTQLYGISLTTLLYVTMIIFLPIIQLLGYMVRAIHKTKVFAFSGMISSGLNLFGILIFVVFLHQGLKGLLVSAVLANLFNSIYLFLGGGLQKYISIRYYSKDEGRRLLSYSIPLIFNLVFVWFTYGFSRFYINLSIGSTANGIYAFANKFAILLLQVAQIINMTMIEDAVLTNGTADWTKRFEENIEKVVNVFFQVSLLFIPVVGIYYQTVSNQKFQSSLVYVPFMIFSVLLSNISVLLGNIFSVFNQTSKIFISTAISGVVNMVGAVLLGHFWGILGVVLAQILGGMVLIIIRYIHGNKIEKYSFNFKVLIINTLFFGAVSLVVLSRKISLQIVVLLLVSIIIGYLYRKFIADTLLNLKNKLSK